MPIVVANTSCEDCTFRSLIFDKLSPEEYDLLNKAKVELRFKKGEQIITEGKEIMNFIYVRNGLVKLSKKTVDNKEHIVSLARTKTFIGFLTIFSQRHYQYTITALAETDVCLIDINVVKDLVRRNGDFALNVLSKISDASDEIIYNRVNICSKQLRGRIAYLLILLSKEIFLNAQFYLPITRREMGELIDMSTANVIRIISEFRKEGILDIQDHTIKIKDFKALERISRAG